MKPRSVLRRLVQPVGLALALLMSIVLIDGLAQDADALGHLGSSLANHSVPLEGSIVRATGEVLAQLGLRARVHLVLAAALAALLVVLTRRRTARA